MRSHQVFYYYYDYYFFFNKLFTRKSVCLKNEKKKLKRFIEFYCLESYLIHV